MNLPLFIAGRYLFAKKSHNVINIISAISMTGMAVGTAALIIILSVYNGFSELVEKSMSGTDPDILVTPVRGKVFVPEGEAFDWLYGQQCVATISEILSDNVFLDYDGKQALARAKGVDKVYEEESPIREHMLEGTFSLHRGSLPLASVSSGLAYRLDLSPRFLAHIEIYYPSRTGGISVSNPAASLESVSLRPGSVFSINSETDEDLLIVPIETMRELLQYESEVSGIEIRLRPESGKSELNGIINGLSERLGGEFRILDRYHQNESVFKMMKYEKGAVFLILIFVIIIIAFSIFGCLSMLIIEKREDIGTLRSLGATGQLIRRIFVLEGWLISLTGLAAGLVAGVAFSLAQQKFGFIRMPAGFMVSSYPVILKAGDILITAAGVAAIGYLIALIPAQGLRKIKD